MSGPGGRNSSDVLWRKTYHRGGMQDQTLVELVPISDGNPLFLFFGAKGKNLALNSQYIP